MNKGKNEGITLIALVITIIVLLILVGVSLSLVLGEEGLIGRTISAREVNENAEEKELVELAVSSAQIDGEGTITTDKLNNALNETFHNDTEASENEEGWDYQGNKKYKIYQDGKVEDVGNSESILPKEYQQVEYIESTGTQYIDTKIIPTNFENLKVKYTSTFSEGTKYVIGSFEQDFYYGLRRGVNNAWGVISEDYAGLRWHSVSGIYDIDFTPEVNKYYEIIQDGDKLYIDGVLYNGNFIVSAKKITGTIPLYVMARNNKGIADCLATVKLKEIHIEYDNNIKNFVPCYCTTAVTDVNGRQCQSGTIGLYDTVEGKFYTNQGTGTFLKGNDI